VELDPAGPAWTKVLYPDPITSELIREDRVFIWEHLTIAGDLSWTGWWEHVDAPGFEWVLEDAGPLGNVRAEARVNGIPAPGLNVEVAADWLRFSFERLPPGTNLDIITELAYAGTPPLADQMFTIQQFPVPEPTAGALLVMGGAVLWLRRRGPAGPLFAAMLASLPWPSQAWAAPRKRRKRGHSTFLDLGVNKPECPLFTRFTNRNGWSRTVNSHFSPA